MKKLVVNIPDAIEFDEHEALLAIASKLYERGKLSLGQAAELAGYSKRAFMEILNNYGVSVFNFPHSDLNRDVENGKTNNL